LASTDWSELTGNLSSTDVRRGVTGGHTPPNGGGTFVYGMRSVIVANGTVALFTNQANFAPTPSNKGMSVRGAIKRATSAGEDKFEAYLFAGCQESDVASNAYALGLTAGNPCRLALVKGPLASGIPDQAPGVAPGNVGVLRRSSGNFAIDTWLHLRLDMHVNTNGDTVLSVFQNDLASNPVTAPVWAAVAGLEQVIDDALGANTGTPPYLNGRMGFGARFQDTYRAVYFDHIECIRET
jgi:hypothetical protein